MPHAPRSTHARATPARTSLILALLAALASAACVTERTTRTQWGTPRGGVPLKGGAAGKSALGAGPPSTSAPSRVSTPVSTPARDAAQHSAAARVSLAPLGEVPYDGQTLPLLSPDGQCLATRVLNDPGPATGDPADAPAHIEIYSLKPPPLGQPRRVLPSEPGASLLAMASASPDHFLICERRADDTRCRFSLVAWKDGVQTPLGDEPEDIAPHMPPVMLGRAGSAMALAVLDEADPADLRTILEFGSARDADQIAQTLTSHIDPPGAAHSAIPRGPVAMVYHPERRRMVVVDTVSEASLDLAEESVNGCFDPAPLSPPGSVRVFVCTAEALLEQTLDFSAGQPRASPPRTIWPEPFVPRATSNPQRPFVLIGPDSTRGSPLAADASAPPRLRLVAFDPAP